MNMWFFKWYDEDTKTYILFVVDPLPLSDEQEDTNTTTKRGVYSYLYCFEMNIWFLVL